MAVVGSAYIKISALTDGIAPDIQKAFSSIDSDSIGSKLGKSVSKSVSKNVDSNIFAKISESLSDFGGAAGTARNQFYQLTKSFNISGVAGVGLIGTLSSLVGGVVGLAGAVGGAVPAVMGLVGAFVTLKVGMSVGSLALSGVSEAVSSAISQQRSYAEVLAETARKTRDLAFASEDAILAVGRSNLNFEQARSNLLRTQDLPASSFARRQALQQYAEAELALRKAKARVKDAKNEQKNPTSSGGAADPFAGLTESQKPFAAFLVDIQGKLDALKEAAAKGFLPILQTNLESIITNVFPTFETGLNKIGVGLGGLTTELSKAITDPGNVKLLGEVMSNIAGDLPIIGTILGNVYSSFLIILNESAPLVTNFLNFLNTKTKSMKDYLKAKEASGEMETFLKRSEEIMGDLGDIFDNVLGGFGAIIAANFEPGSGGDIMIQWLKDATKKFDDLDKTAEGKKALKQYFIDVANNSTAVLDSIGALIKELILLGANQNIGKTFTALKEGAPAFGEFANKLVDAGPSLGQLVADITVFINSITDTKAITNFFDTIDVFVKGITAFVQNPIVSPILGVLGQIHGVIFGIVAITKVGGFISKYLGESYEAVKNLVTGIKDIPGNLQNMASKAMEARDKVVEIGTKAVDMAKTAGSAFADWGKQMGTYAIESLKSAATAVGDLSKKIALNTIEIAKNVAQWVAQKAALVASTVAKVALNVATTIGTAIQAAFNFVLALNPFVLIAIAVAALVAGLIYFFTQTELGKKIWADFTKFLSDSIQVVGKWFSDVWGGITKFASETWTNVSKGVTNFVNGIPKAIAGIGKFFSDVFNGIPTFISGIWTKIIGTVTGFVTNIVNGVDKIFPGFKTVFNNVVSFFKGIINTMIGFAEGFVNFFIRGLNGIVGAINGIKVDIPEFLRPLLGGAKSIGFSVPKIPELKLPRLAKGGTVMPSSGGSLVNVAEAGRAERIEPLDSSGLSKRDRAMIELLSGGRGGSGRPIQLNVYPSAGMDERQLAEIVSRTLAFELRRGGV